MGMSSTEVAASRNVIAGRRVFESRRASLPRGIRDDGPGRFGPTDALMSRDTIAAGAAPNTPQWLASGLRNPDAIKPGSEDPAMGLAIRPRCVLPTWRRFANLCQLPSRFRASGIPAVPAPPPRRG